MAERMDTEDFGDDLNPWDAHVRFMYDTFGRRDPDCTWCGETVVMELQGFYGGGIWTTRRDHEGPCGGGWGDHDPDALRCEASPDGQHDVAVRAGGPKEEHR